MSPDAMAAITSAPEANLRHSTSQPVALENLPSAAATCIGVGLPKWPMTTVSAEAAPTSTKAAAPAASVVLICLSMYAAPLLVDVYSPSAAACPARLPPDDGSSTSLLANRTIAATSASSVSMAPSSSASVSEMIENSEQATS